MNIYDELIELINDIKASHRTVYDNYYKQQYDFEQYYNDKYDKIIKFVKRAKKVEELLELYKQKEKHISKYVNNFNMSFDTITITKLSNVIGKIRVLEEKLEKMD